MNLLVHFREFIRNNQKIGIFAKFQGRFFSNVVGANVCNHMKKNAIQRLVSLQAMKAYKGCLQQSGVFGLPSCLKIVKNIPEVLSAVPILAGSIAETYADTITPDTDRKFAIKNGIGLVATIGTALLIGASVPEALTIYLIGKVTHRVAGDLCAKLYQRIFSTIFP